jgi:hypothetical protein
MAMLALPELQSHFKDGLLAVEDPSLLDLIDGDGLDPRARLAVYRHHVLTTLTAALEAVYPVVCRLVDRRFFGYAADAFIRQHPPAGPCLGEYGADFADFLAAFPPCAQLPCLPDIARLEWALHRAALAPPAATLDHERLGAVDPARMAELTFTPDPSLSYLASPWPVDRIWRAHQDTEGPAEAMDAAVTGVWLEIRAVGDRVTLRSLEPATYAFRDALRRGSTLGEAVGVALGSHPSFDVGSAIESMLDDRLFSYFTIATEGEAST